MNNDRASSAAWGITLFLLMLAVAVISFVVIGPAIDGINDAFDDDYKNEYMSETGISTADTIYNMYGYIILVVMMLGLAYVIVTAIRSDKPGGF